MDDAKQRIPQYQCHKKVRAAKIIEIHYQLGAKAVLKFEEDIGLAVVVDAVYLTKHDPRIGGYYILYEDGYESFSPAQAFEEGYTRI